MSTTKRLDKLEHRFDDLLGDREQDSRSILCLLRAFSL